MALLLLKSIWLRETFASLKCGDDRLILDKVNFSIDTADAMIMVEDIAWKSGVKNTNKFHIKNDKPH